MKNQRYLALFRGINVGGHKKVPMADLKQLMSGLCLEKVQTLLNSGNVLFTTSKTEVIELEKIISLALEKTFGFEIPVIIRKAIELQTLIANNPFETIEMHKDLRLYLTFLRDPVENMPLEIPWISRDGSFRIIGFTGKEILSVLDVREKKTTDAMKILEQSFGKDLTTRNWNTILKLEKLV